MRTENRRGIRLNIGDALVVIVAGASLLCIASDPFPALMLVADLTPLVALGALGAAILTWRAGRPIWIRMLAACAAVVTFARIVPDIVASAAPLNFAAPAGPLVKVVTVNLNSSNYKVGLVQQLINREQPDIIIAQEAFGVWGTFLEKLPSPYRIVGGCEHPHLCNSVIVSKFEMSRKSDTADSCCTLVTVRLPSELGGGDMGVVGLHFSRTLNWQRRQEELENLFAKLPTYGPTNILAGDLNALPWSATVRQLDRRSGLVRVTRFFPSWPTPQGLFPIFPIDHIYAGCGWRPTSLKRGPDVGSDHYPIIATFTRDACQKGS